MIPATRRRFLAALGAAGLTATRSLGAAPPTAGARGRDGPLRFIAVYTPHGRAHELWEPRAGFDLTFPDAILQPFDDPRAFGASFKPQLLVLDGIDLTAGMLVGTTGHDGSRVILTGSGADGKNPSLDQYLAVHLGLGADTPHATVALGVGHEGSELGLNLSYAAGGAPLPKWIDPAQTFAELFGSPLAGESGAELERRRLIGKSVLDFVRGDLVSLGRRAGTRERTKLDQHAAALREIEKRLTAVPSCAPPPKPDAARFPKTRAYGGGEPYFDAVTDLQIDLLARALACDVTRFATLHLADLSRTGVDPALPADVHNEVAHRYAARTSSSPGDPSSWAALARQNRYSARKVARLLDRLREAGILDDCIVYVSSDMGDPARHSSQSVPTLLAGGTGGRFKMGRHIDLRPAGGVPNNRVLVSIGQAFGADMDRFGHAADPSVVTGRLESLYG